MCMECDDVMLQVLAVSGRHVQTISSISEHIPGSHLAVLVLQVAVFTAQLSTTNGDFAAQWQISCPEVFQEQEEQADLVILRVHKLQVHCYDRWRTAEQRLLVEEGAIASTT